MELSAPGSKALPEVLDRLQCEVPWAGPGVGPRMVLPTAVGCAWHSHLPGTWQLSWKPRSWQSVLWAPQSHQGALSRRLLPGCSCVHFKSCLPTQAWDSELHLLALGPCWFPGPHASPACPAPPWPHSLPSPRGGFECFLHSTLSVEHQQSRPSSCQN